MVLLVCSLEHTGILLEVDIFLVRHLPKLDENIPDEWVSITSDFVGINAVNISHLSADSVYYADKGFGSDYIVLHLFPTNLPK